MEPTEIFLTLQSDLVSHNRKRIAAKSPCDESLYDKSDVGEMFDITLEDGTKLEAYADEIVPIHYYELDFVRYDDNNVPRSDFSICILGTHEPTDIEAKEFVKDDLSRLGYEGVMYVGELTHEEAMDFFDMEREDTYPIFGLEHISRWERYFEKNP